MRVGIFLDYKRGGMAPAGIRLAEALQAMGYPVTVGSPGTRRLDPVWDRRVRALGDYKSLKKWAAGTDVIIFVRPPTDGLLEAASGQKRRLIALATTDYADEASITAMAACSATVCPTPRTASLFRRLGVKHVSCVPWASLSTPLHRLPVKATPSLLFPTHDGLTQRFWPAAHFRLLDKVLAKCSTSLTILWETSRCPSSWRAALDRLKRRYPDRVHVDRRPPGGWWPDRAVVCAGHDLVYYPVETEAFGLTALDALAVGTPVACYAAWPQNEYVSYAAGEGLYLPSMVSAGPLGLASIVLDREAETVETLADVLSSPTMMARLALTASLRAKARSRDFLAGWRSLLGDG